MSTFIGQLFTDDGLTVRCRTWLPLRNKHRVFDFKRHKISHVRVNLETGRLTSVVFATFTLQTPDDGLLFFPALVLPRCTTYIACVYRNECPFAGRCCANDPPKYEGPQHD